MQRIKGLAALYAISQELANASDQQRMLVRALQILDTDLSMTKGTIMLLSLDGQELVFEATYSPEQKRPLSARYRRGEGIIGRVVESAQPILVPKVSEEPLFLDRLHKRRQQGAGDVSFICVPIKIGSEVVGTLSVDCLYDLERDLDVAQQILSVVAGMIASDVRSRRALIEEVQLLEAENMRLKNELECRFRPENIIGNSNVMRQLYQSISQVAPSETTVLIRGESGTGKELVAHAIHYTSPRAKGPFVRVNCAALNPGVLESELFGHERGAFTGALKDRKGWIAAAEGGTLFFDEIGDFPLSTQVKLLRVLQEREYQSVGSSRTHRADVRFVAATNRNLEQAVQDGLFREDFYYRINVFPLFMPPLRDRKDDILLLANFFVEKHSQKMSKDVHRISTTAINMLMIYHWPGNVRELENCIERAVLISADGVIHGHHLPPTLQVPTDAERPQGDTLREQMDIFECDIISDTLKKTGGNVASAARILGSTSRIVRYRIEKLGLSL